jgi:hypothetical protein
MGKASVMVTLLTVFIACFCLACTKSPNSKITSDQADALNLRAQIKEVVYEANKAAFAMCVQGFDEELREEDKKPFSYYEPALRKWYSETMTARLEFFYNEHLGEWGYEMGFAFPLHTKELVQEGFLSLELNTATKVTILFMVPAGHEETCITKYTLEKQKDGSWIITMIE